MITGRVSLGPTNAYLSVARFGFNSSAGGDSNAGNDSHLIVQGRVVSVFDVSTRIFTSSLLLSISQSSTPKCVKWVSQESCAKIIDVASSMMSLNVSISKQLLVDGLWDVLNSIQSQFLISK